MNESSEGERRVRVLKAMNSDYLLLLLDSVSYKFEPV